jgi:shikimate 5-dehydrogenase
MLVEQAAEAFYAWYQKRVNTAAIIAELRCSFFDHATEI